MLATEDSSEGRQTNQYTVFRESRGQLFDKKTEEKVAVSADEDYIQQAG